jgi:hypothetical protein
MEKYLKKQSNALSRNGHSGPLRVRRRGSSLTEKLLIFKNTLVVCTMKIINATIP